MPFQFYCPQGHLLEGHETQMGQQSQCPYCGSVFTMPIIGAVPMGQPGWTPSYQPAPSPPGVPYQPAPGFPGGVPGYPGMVPAQNAYPGQMAPWPNHVQPAGESTAPTETFPDVTEGAAGFPQIKTEAAAGAPPAEAAASEPAAAAKPEPEAEKKEPRIVRIPCPHGHELQTPMDMVGQDVLCPICNTQFHLRYEDSIEFKEERAELRRLKEENLNKVALKWSIIAAAVVLLSIVGMVIYHEWQKEPEPEPAALPSEAAPAETGPTSDPSGRTAPPESNPQE